MISRACKIGRDAGQVLIARHRPAFWLVGVLPAKSRFSTLREFSS
jgi:hypothetical protein